ncbi:unnamed protein product [Cuscuta epithymum]|uniref:ATP synthase F1 complex delta/epsilon subunit N-terminal domain-containing protein n=1 Tax=Cuscuta epithymum TaxID=186058 RepID=A0AAV0GH45_9ASTE|nr:unnamed protein product [Cuscuta epithymum]CAH9147288.1 unnamed protein product [Cuscuta epithymum]
MFRHAATRLWNRSASSARASRQFSSPSADEAFVSAWRRVVPTVDPPKTPLSFMKFRPPTSSATPSKLKINFILPYASEFSNNEVDMVIVSTTTGELGILPGHVATIAELKPGVMSVHEGNDVMKYFVSGGFAFVHSNSVTDIMALEAVPIEKIDPDIVEKGLAELKQKLSSASTELQKAEAQIGVDVLTALNFAVMGG